MTIHNQQPQQPFIPLPDASQARPMPAKIYQRQRAEQVDEPTASSQQYREQLPLIPTQRMPRRKRRLRISVIALLLVLTGAVGVASFFAPRFFQTSSGTGTHNIQGVTPGGPFVKPPLSSTQVDAIMHLSGYMKDKALASLYVSHMTLDEELGQLIMVEYADGCGSASGVCPGVTSYYESDLDTMINTLHAGGVIMYEFQMQNFNQTKNDLAKMQSRASIPLLISADEEGGPYVHRLSHIDGYRMSATDIANSGSTDVAAQQGAKTAHDLLALGINEDLAPDVDVNLVNGYDMVTRTFGNTPDSVVKYASAYIKAMQGAGVVGCIKHFPGLGDAVTDAHTSLPVVNQTRDQIYSIDLAPFKAFIQSPDALENPGMIMPTDVLMPAIDPVYPAELSHTFMTDILRNEFGYDGVVLTDALYMQGITQKWSMNTAAVMALNAGNDMLLGPTGPDQMLSMINTLKAALQNGTLSKARVDQAATRIIALKMEYHLMPATMPQE
ncbi:MAG TPA: glycoside hydrolase family 3 N-terminal domain-containing protein [Ktedonobacteraceae bacterium]|nr:glycoside hydrolase family 3 N-terminal domain-containing protein [Ktedonobacteraceae bacterium]